MPSVTKIGLVPWVLPWMLTFMVTALGQEGTTVSAAVSPSVVSVGQEGSYTITLSGARAVGEFPRKIVVPGLELIFKRKARRFAIVKGRSVQRIELNYSVTAEREGKFKIPAQSVVVGKTSIQTNAVVLTARRGMPDEAAKKPVLRIEVPKAEVYVGEVIPIALVVDVPAGAQFRPKEHPKMNPEGFALKRFSVPVPGGHSDGWAKYRYESSFSAITSGDLTLGPGELAFSVSYPPKRVGRTPFASRWSSKNYRMKTDSINVVVKPLPTHGAPSGFQGAVGSFTMQVSASPLELQVNDPLVIDAKITGIGNFDRLTAPGLTERDGWRLQNAREYMENRSNGLKRGTTAFSQVAQPLRVMKALPALEFSFLTLKRAPIGHSPLNRLPWISGRMTARQGEWRERISPRRRPASPRRNWEIS